MASAPAFSCVSALSQAERPAGTSYRPLPAGFQENGGHLGIEIFRKKSAIMKNR
jgi:hypothetical protein